MTNKKRLKILFIPAWYPSEKNSIAGIFIKEHAKAAALYNDIVVLYSEGICTSLKSSYEIRENIEDGLRTIRLRYRKSPIPKTTYFIYLWSIFSAFRKLLKEGCRPDIIHAHVYSAGIPSVILGKLYKIPTIITEHYIYFPPRILSFPERLKARFVMNRILSILVPTNAYKEAIESYGIKNNFQIVPNVVNTELFYPLPFKREKDGKKHLLFVGNLVPKKSIPFLLKALSVIKKQRQDFILDIVGNGPNRNEYEELAYKLSLREVVRFHGMKQKGVVARFMRNCSFFVMPSLYEGFGVVYIEAMACGKPVIATKVRGPDEIINKDVGILVPPEDINELVESIEYMLDHYQDYSSDKIDRKSVV